MADILQNSKQQAYPGQAIVKQLGTPLLLSFSILLALAIIVPNQAWFSAQFTGEALLSISPFILLSVGIAAALKASGADQTVARAFEGNQFYTIALASAMGALSPFCSCGVVPLVAGLLAAGVPIAPVLAFCLASPIMDPEMFILTAAGLGMEITFAKTLSAMAMGLFAGYTTMIISKTGFLDDALKSIAKPSCSASSCGGPSMTPEKVDWQFWRQGAKREKFWSETRSSGWFLGRWLAFAFLLESLMVTYIPAGDVASLLGENNPFALPLAVVVGVPAYLNGYAAIPLVRGLLDLGMAPATGLSFMLAGSVTSIPAAIAIWTLAKPRLFGLYLAFGALGSLGCGLAYMTYLSWV